VPNETRRRRVDDLLNLIALPGAGDKLVSELSGGMRQRVAIARALAVEPQVLLLDEPLSALDLKLRQHMRNELRNIQQRVGITFIYITHDQGEALTMSDRIAVMNAGVIEQVGDGRSVYDRPETAFVASFVGENNPFEGRVVAAENGHALIESPIGRLRGRNRAGLSVGDPAVLFVRPETFAIGQGREDGSLESEVLNVAFEGNMTHLFLRGPSAKKPIMVTVPRGTGAAIPEQGSRAAIRFDPEDALVLPAGSLARE
jgi:spermidine/putrescine transport system ATP-binding protein